MNAQFSEDDFGTTTYDILQSGKRTPEQLRHLVMRLSEGIVRLASIRAPKYERVNSQQEEMDCAQDVVLKILEHDKRKGLPAFESVEHVNRFLNTVFSSYLTDKWRRLRAIVRDESSTFSMLDSDDVTAPDELSVMEQEERDQELKDALVRMEHERPELRDIINRVVMLGDRYADVARDLGISVGTVSNRKDEAIEWLRRKLS